MTEFGRRLFVTRVGLEATEEDLRQLIFKYTHRQPSLVERVDREAALAAYIIAFPLLPDGEIQKIAERLNMLFWHGHMISVNVI